MATLDDIARECGVSKATVSRVLRGDPQFSVSEQTRDLIRSTAQAMNYRSARRSRSAAEADESAAGQTETAPAAFSSPASSLEQIPRTLQIGLINFDQSALSVSDEYYAVIINAFIAAAQSIRLAEQIRFRYIASYDELDDIDALVIVGKFVVDPSHPKIAAVKYKTIVDYTAPNGTFDSVNVDFREAVRLAADYFRSIGVDDIGFVGAQDCISRFGSEDKIRTSDVRQLAFLEDCREHGLSPDERIWIAERFSPECGYEITRKLLKGGGYPKALLYASDDLALGAYNAFQEQGVRIGQDISLISMDDMSYTRFLTPPLTTVALNMNFMGQAIACSLKSQIMGRRFPIAHTTPIELKIRSSCADAVTHIPCLF